jgi:hypothetical protein
VRSLRPVVSIVLAAGLVLTTASTVTAAPPAVVRVSQLGYGASDGKAAYLMTQGVAANRAFEVVDRHGRRVLTGKVGRDAGEWNAKYQHVYELDLSALKRPGSYRIEVPGIGSSPTFEVKTEQLLEGAKDKGVTFFTEQRDGANVVPGPLGRQPSHLTDRAADVYDWPVFAGPEH